MILNFPLFSVVIPNRNRIEQLDVSVESVLKQTCQEWEILIIDDSDPDIFKKIIERFGNSEKIKIIQGDRKYDFGARCKGFEASTGRYVAFLDSGDYWKPEKLAYHLEFFQMYPGAGVVWDNLIVRKIDGTEFCVGKYLANDDSFALVKRIKILNDLVLANFIHMSCGVVNKQLIEAINGPFMKRPFDYILWMEAAKHYDFGYVNQSLTYKVESRDWLGSNKKVLFLENYETEKEKVGILLSKKNDLRFTHRFKCLVYSLLRSPGIHILLPRYASDKLLRLLRIAFSKSGNPSLKQIN